MQDLLLVIIDCTTSNIGMFGFIEKNGKCLRKYISAIPDNEAHYLLELDQAHNQSSGRLMTTWYRHLARAPKKAPQP
jgi:hypothetical protein